MAVDAPAFSLDWGGYMFMFCAGSAHLPIVSRHPSNNDPRYGQHRCTRVPPPRSATKGPKPFIMRLANTPSVLECRSTSG